MQPPVGTIFKLKVPCLGNPSGALGVVYENYGDEGVSLVFKNGSYDGFSKRDRENFLEPVGMSSELAVLDYEFKNVTKVTDDFRKGLWNKDLGNK